MDHCDECGFSYGSVPRAGIATRLAGFGARYRTTLGEVPDPRGRPSPAVWSPLEYTCHVRDVLRVQRERLALALAVDVPEYAPMRRDERAVEERYNDQDVAVVLADLDAAAQELGRAFAALTPAQWDRTGVYNYPAPHPRAMDWLGRHTVHEGEHHLGDLRRR